MLQISQPVTQPVDDDVLGKSCLKFKRLLGVLIVFEVATFFCLFFMMFLWILWVVVALLSIALISLGFTATSRRNRMMLQVYSGLSLAFLIFVSSLVFILLCYVTFFVLRSHWLAYIALVLAVVSIILRIFSVVHGFKLAKLVPAPQFQTVVAMHPIAEAQPLTQAIQQQQPEDDQLPMPAPAVAPAMFAMPYGAMPLQQPAPVFYVTQQQQQQQPQTILPPAPLTSQPPIA